MPDNRVNLHLNWSLWIPTVLWFKLHLIISLVLCSLPSYWSQQVLYTSISSGKVNTTLKITYAVQIHAFKLTWSLHCRVINTRSHTLLKVRGWVLSTQCTTWIVQKTNIYGNNFCHFYNFFLIPTKNNCFLLNFWFRTAKPSLVAAQTVAMLCYY